MTSILGISAFYHDSAAALLIDGKIIAAAQEERFTRKKHDSSYPFHAVEYVLREAKLKLNEMLENIVSVCAMTLHGGLNRAEKLNIRLKSPNPGEIPRRGYDLS